MADKIFELLLDMYSGRQTVAEINGYREFSINRVQSYFISFSRIHYNNIVSCVIALAEYIQGLTNYRRMEYCTFPDVRQLATSLFLAGNVYLRMEAYSKYL